MLKLRLINAVEVLFILSSRLLMLLTNEPYCKESDYWIRIFIIILKIDSNKAIYKLFNSLYHNRIDNDLGWVLGKKNIFERNLLLFTKATKIL